MCYHTLLDHTIYMDAQMQNKCFVNTSQVIYNAILARVSLHTDNQQRMFTFALAKG